MKFDLHMHTARHSPDADSDPFELVRAAPGCLDYVLLHECCHLLVGDHSQAFYDLQTRLLPDWERWKAELNALPK